MRGWKRGGQCWLVVVALRLVLVSQASFFLLEDVIAKRRRTGASILGEDEVMSSSNDHNH